MRQRDLHIVSPELADRREVLSGVSVNRDRAAHGPHHDTSDTKSMMPDIRAIPLRVSVGTAA